MPSPPRSPSGVAFRLHGRGIEFATPTDAVAKRVARALPAYAGPLPAVGGERWWLREHHGTWAVEPDGIPGDRFPTLDAALEAVEFLIACRLLALHRDVAQLHAAGAVVRGRALLAIGPSGAGKTSLALSWSRAGLPTLGDDVVLIGQDGRIHSFRRLFQTERARLAAVGLEPDPALVWTPDDPEVRYDPAVGGGWADPAPVSLLAFAMRDSTAPPTIAAMSRPEALSLLIGALLPTGLDATAGFERLARIAADAQAVRVTFADAPTAAAALAALA